MTTNEAQRDEDLEREVKELRRANEILKRRALLSRRRSSTADASDERFIDANRSTHGVEPICKVLQVAPSGYRRYGAQR